VLRSHRSRVARGLKLRHDHGSNYMSGDFQDEIECLGIEASPSFVREPEGNGVAERFIRTLKENLLWVRTFGAERAARAVSRLGAISEGESRSYRNHQL
jgi:transposase InsO family protein